MSVSPRGREALPRICTEHLLCTKQAQRYLCLKGWRRRGESHPIPKHAPLSKRAPVYTGFSPPIGRSDSPVPPLSGSSKIESTTRERRPKLISVEP